MGQLASDFLTSGVSRNLLVGSLHCPQTGITHGIVLQMAAGSALG
jgi:hypothetical protein